MRALIGRSTVIVGIGGLSLASAGVLAPGAFAADTINGDVAVSNTETVQVLMSASGEINAQRVYEQLVLRGDGKVDIANPVSDKGLRNLDGFGGFDVQDGEQRVKTEVDGTKKYRSVSDYTKKLPIDIDIAYTFDGKKVEPGDIVGKSGDLKVRYLVTNTTGKTQEVEYRDGDGKQTSSSEEVVVPIVGSLTTVLPSTFTKVKSAEANAAGDGRGGTQLSFTMTLIPPIGKSTAEFGYEARVSDGVVPRATVSVLPVNPLESPSFKGGAASYKGGADTGQDLTAGATEIDANVLKLRDGASDLVAGILKLQAGANQLSAGLNSEVAPGAKRLAAGAGKLDAGANRLDEGSGKLAAGLAEAKGGAPALLEGVAKLKAGAQQVDAGLVTLQQTVAGGVGSPAQNGTLRNGVAKIIGGLGGVDTGLDGVNGALTGALQLANSLDDALPQKTQLVGALKGAQGGVGSLKGAIGALTTGANDLDGGLQQLAGGVGAGVGTPGQDKTLRGGMAQLIGGLDLLSDKGGDLVDGLGQLSEGAEQLQDGTGDLQGGTGELSAGASKLSTGLQDKVAPGAGKLADGLDQAAEGAPRLPKGADRLSKEGTSVLAEKGNETAMDYGLKYALIEAGAERAGTAQPYGSPKGATALTAYKFEIAGENGAGSANLKRGLAAIALLAGAGVLAAVRRRGLI